MRVNVYFAGTRNGKSEILDESLSFSELGLQPGGVATPYPQEAINRINNNRTLTQEQKGQQVAATLADWQASSQDRDIDAEVIEAVRSYYASRDIRVDTGKLVIKHETDASGQTVYQLHAQASWG